MYLFGYIFVCSCQVLFTIIDAIDGEFSYRNSYDHESSCRPPTYAEYTIFRRLQDGNE